MLLLHWQILMEKHHGNDLTHTNTKSIDRGNRNMNGSLVISLDWEMMWGAADWLSAEEYGQSNIKHVPQVIERLLELFVKYDIHATFATVGLIFCRDKQHALNLVPEDKPSYDNMRLSIYANNYLENIKSEKYPLYFAPELVERLKQTPNIELGSHTFCHYNCWAPGQTLKQFENDIQQACKVAAEYGVELRSIVFPRNEVVKECVEICAKYGIVTYRGNAKKFFGQPKGKFHNMLQKAGRLLNSYIKMGAHSVIKYSEIDKDAECMNVPATRFLRYYSEKLRLLDPLRLHLIKSEMEYAAKTGALCHLWWHPHNFGANMEQNLAFLEKVLKHYKYCKEKYDMKSFTMNEFRDFLKAEN